MRLWILNLAAFGNVKSILDFELFVGLLHIYWQFETTIDILFYNIFSSFIKKSSLKPN